MKYPYIDACPGVMTCSFSPKVIVICLGVLLAFCMHVQGQVIPAHELGFRRAVHHYSEAFVAALLLTPDQHSQMVEAWEDMQKTIQPIYQMGSEVSDTDREIVRAATSDFAQFLDGLLTPEQFQVREIISEVCEEQFARVGVEFDPLMKAAGDEEKKAINHSKAVAFSENVREELLKRLPEESSRAFESAADMSN